jgi:hypothetical protein
MKARHGLKALLKIRMSSNPIYLVAPSGSCWQHAVSRTPHARRTTIEDVGVDHRRAQIPMAQQFLNGADVVTVLKKVRREGMPERVTGCLFRDAGLQDGLANCALDEDSCR